jgi:VWFA-related protein
MGEGRSGTVPLVYLLGILAGAAPLRAQAPQAPATTVLPATDVELVRIEVVVKERGRPRIGLRREDFAVLEDGRLQAIVEFQAFARPGEAAAPSPPGAVAAEGVTEGEPRLPARHVVLVIDDVHIEFASLVRVRTALERFLEEDLRPADHVALVTTSGAPLLSQEFTSDRAILRQTLSRLSGQGRRPDWNNVHISEYQAQMIQAGEPIALAAAIQEILALGIFPDAGSAEREARSRARIVLAEAVHDSRRTLEVLEGVCRGLSGIAGRKALFLVSDGFIAGLSAGSSFDMRRIADAATRAGVVVYALDARGLIGLPPAMRAESLNVVTPQTAGAIETMARRSEEGMRAAMNSIAVDTGGFMVENTNDLRAGLRTLAKDTETYYLLAYEPTNTRRDGAFRRIEVRLPAVRGVKVRTRSGYFAADERRVLASATGADAARHEEQRRAEMGAALGALAPLTGIPVRLAADFVSRDGAAGEVVVNGRVDVGTLPFVRRDDRLLATVDTVAVVLDETGRVAAMLDAEHRSLDLSDADRARLALQGLPYSRAVAVKPGRYRVCLAARDDASGLLGSAWRRIEVPDLTQGHLALSGPFLMKDEGPRSAGDSAPVLHAVQELPRFSRAEGLYVQLFAYNPKRDAKGTIDLVSQAAILKGGAALATAAPEPMVADATGSPVGHLSRIRLPHLEPGEYELRITVTDRIASATVSHAVPFTVD